MSRILITGITGQDGSYLTESHLASGDEVHGMVRQSSLLQRTRLDSLPALRTARETGRLSLHYADLQDTSSLIALMRKVTPDVVYHLAGQSHVGISFDMPEYTAEATGLGTLRLLEAVRQVAPECRFFFAATSEIFGEPLESAADGEDADGADQSVRRGEGLRAEPRPDLPEGVRAPRLGRESSSTTRARAGARTTSRGRSRAPPRGSPGGSRRSCTSGRSSRGATGATRWTWWTASAGSWRPTGADDYVLASGVSHSVRDFCEAAFSRVGLDYRKHVVLDPTFVRPLDISETRGDSSKARRQLGWAPKTGFDELVRIMVDAELAALDRPAESA